jgi:hypothetical protein
MVAVTTGQCHLIFTPSNIGHSWWGGPPGPQPGPWPACRERQALDSSGEERVQGDPRGPRGPPHHPIQNPTEERLHVQTTDHLIRVGRLRR